MTRNTYYLLYYVYVLITWLVWLFEQFANPFFAFRLKLMILHHHVVHKCIMSKSNSFINQVWIKNKTHPLIRARSYLKNWIHSSIFKKIKSMHFNVSKSFSNKLTYSLSKWWAKDQLFRPLYASKFSPCHLSWVSNTRGWLVYLHIDIIDSSLIANYNHNKGQKNYWTLFLNITNL
jgi:hypothetical protein